MKNIEIKVSKTSRMVYLKNGNIGNDGENLQEKLIFSFQDKFVDGQARLEYEIGEEKYFAILTKVGESYELPIKNVITKEGQVNMQLVITEGTDENEIPVFKSNVFYVVVNESINAESEEPDGYVQWLDIANTKLNNIDEAVLGVQEAVDYANEQGDYAKEQAENVISASEEANEIIENFEINVGSYTSAFNENAENKVSDYNTNATNKVKEYNDNATEKLNAYNTNAETKLQEYNENANSKVGEYNANADNRINDFNQNADSYLDAIVPKNDASGVPIYVDDALEYRVLNLDAKGNYEQETTTGKNLFSGGDNITFTQNKFIHLEKPIPAGTYTISAIITSSDTDDTRNLIQFRSDESGTQYTSISLARNTRDNTTKTINFEVNYISLYASTGSAISSGDTATFKDMQIEAGNSMTDYEPYTGNQASPNPDYPQEIEVIEGDVSYEAIGKQLYNYKNSVVVTTNGITRDEDGWITATWDNTNSSSARYLYYFTNNLNLKPNTNYAVVLEIKNVSGQNLQNSLIYPYMTSSSQTEGQFTTSKYYRLSNLSSNTIKVDLPITKASFDNVIYGIRSSLSFGAGESGSITFRLSVLEDTSVTADAFVYEKYKELSTPIDLQENFVGKLPNGVADKLLYKDRHIYLEKNVGKIVLGGSEVWRDRPNYTYADRFVTELLFPNNYKDILSNYFIFTQTLSDTYPSAVNNGMQLVINFSAKGTTTLAQFREWMTEHKPEVYYQLTTPQLIDLGEYDLSTLQGTNNISLLANLEPTEMNMTYALDIKKYIDKKVQ